MVCLSSQATAMLTCDICGEEILFEEDMKTHILLSHVENDMHCPLCSLSGVSYDELCFHISSAHPEEQQISQTVTHLTSTSTGTSASMLPEQSSSPGSGCVPPVKTSAISTKKTRQTSASHCNNDINEPKPEHKKAKQQTQLSTKSKCDSMIFTLLKHKHIKSGTVLNCAVCYR